MVLRLQNVHELLMYVIQDVLQVFAIFMMFLLFFSTYVFQAGLVGVLISRFRAPIIASILYLAISIPLHTFLLKQRWDNQFTYVWTKPLTALFIFQRFAAVVHYYLMKRTVLRFSDPRFYTDSAWIREEIMKRH